MSIKLLSLFSGIGAFEKAFDRLGLDYKLVNYCEIDKHASKSYCLIHDENESKNLWDVTKVKPETLPDFDLMTYGFPCQSFSMAGKRKGFEDEEKGDLFNQSMRIVRAKKPKYMIAENVKGLLSIDGGYGIDYILGELEKLGYNNYMDLLNAKDYGIPQNRERVFIVSIRKDIDKHNFIFPEKIPLSLNLSDIILDGAVDRKTSHCLDANYWKGTNYKQYKKKKRRQVVIIDDAFRSRDARIYTDYSPCLKASGSIKDFKVVVDDVITRKLHNIETIRLMGFDDSDYHKIKDHISKTQIYKQCGNSIVVNVLEGILRELFIEDRQKQYLF